MIVLSASVSVYVGVVSVGGRRGHQDVLGLALEKVVRHCDLNLQRQTMLLNNKPSLQSFRVYVWTSANYSKFYWNMISLQLTVSYFLQREMNVDGSEKWAYIQSTENRHWNVTNSILFIETLRASQYWWLLVHLLGIRNCFHPFYIEKFSSCHTVAVLKYFDKGMVFKSKQYRKAGFFIVAREVFGQVI